MQEVCREPTKTPDAPEVLQVLLKEYERLSADIRSIEMQNDKIVGFGLTILGAGFAYGLQQNLVEIFLFLPFAFVAVFLYATLQYHNVLWFGGYKRAVEERINDVVGSDVLIWETIISVRKRSHVGNVPLVTIYLILLTGACSYSISVVFERLGNLYGFLFSAVVILFTAALILSIRRMFGAFDRAYQAAKQHTRRSEAASGAVIGTPHMTSTGSAAAVVAPSDNLPS